MGVLEQITKLKTQGIPDQEIVNNLQEQGISPKEINDALNQAQVKSAVSGTEAENMQPSITAPPSPKQGTYTPQTQEMTEQESASPQTEYAPSQEFYQQDNYDAYASPNITNTDTIIEIAEQVFSEKMKKIQKQLTELNEFKTIAQTKIENTSERLQRIETIIDKLQITILDKIGSYGQNLETIKKEMSMMQDSFGKVVNQAVKKHHTTHKTPVHKKAKKTSKKK